MEQVTHLISLSVGTNGAEDHARTFQDMSELHRSLASAHDYVSLTSQLSGYEGDDEDVECTREHITHTEDTLAKAREIIETFGLNPQSASDLITELHNAGILFRERSRV